METIENAIVLSLQDYEENDSIVRFLNQYGEKITLFAPGIQKPQSKNRQNLIQYSIVEIEYFKSRKKEDGLSGKLKRSTFVKQASIKTIRKQTIIDLFATVIKQVDNLNTKEIYDVFTIMFNSESLFSIGYVIYFLNLILKEFNINVITDHCVRSKKISKISAFSLRDNGIISTTALKENEFKWNIEELKKLISIFNSSNVKEVMSISFSPQYEKLIKDMYIDFFQNVLGINLSLLNKV